MDRVRLQGYEAGTQASRGNYQAEIWLPRSRQAQPHGQT